MLFRKHATCNCFVIVNAEDFIFNILMIQRDLDEFVYISSMCFGTMLLDFVCLK